MQETMNQLCLKDLKDQLKPVAMMQYKTEPQKVINADCEKNADYLMANPMIKIKVQYAHVTRDQIIRLLEEIKSEVILANSIDVTETKQLSEIKLLKGGLNEES